MAVIQSYIQLDDLYHRVGRKLLLNNITLSNDNIKDLIYTTYNNEISMIPQCECGHFVGAYLLGRSCPRCETSVVNTFDAVEPILWVEKFKKELRFINPKFWADLARTISTKIDGLRWLSDTSYNPPTIPPVLLGLKEIIGGRSYLNVVNNLEKIILFLKHNSYFKTLTKQVKLDALLFLIKNNENEIFSDHLPLINKKLFVMETTNKGNYTSVLLSDIIDLALLVISTSNDITMTFKKLETNTAKIISKSAELFTNYLKDLVSRKGGLIRKNIYGTRAHFTFRCVVSSLGVKHDYDTIHVPWMILTTTFRPHVMNKLLARGYKPKAASAKINKATLLFDKEIADIGEELIKEAKGKGIAVLANRNPSLLQSSINLVYITKFKRDTEDSTVSISILIAAGMNMDKIF